MAHAQNVADMEDDDMLVFLDEELTCCSSLASDDSDETKVRKRLGSAWPLCKQ